MNYYYDYPYDYQEGIPTFSETPQRYGMHQGSGINGTHGMYPEGMAEALELIRGAVSGEREDELFYDYLINEAPDQEDKDIITSIRNDERKHNKMFRELYYQLTGQMLPKQMPGEEFSKPISYCEGLKKALFGELGAVERYRRILFALQNRTHINMLTEIITDELKHASKYNYLITKCSTSTKTENIENTQNIKATDVKPRNKTPDEWVRYINPLVKKAMDEVKEGKNLEHLFEEYIISGVLVGLGKTPEEAILQTEKWEKTGESKLLQESRRRSN